MLLVKVIFADFIYSDYSDYARAIEEVKTKVTNLKILGEYSKSKR